MKKLFVPLFLMMTTAGLRAQTWNITDKLYVGGGMGFNFSSNVISYSVSPYAGYMLTNRFSPGLRLTYQYTKFNEVDVRVNSYGLGPFARFQMNEQFFAYTEYEWLTYKIKDSRTTAEIPNRNFNSLFVGGGLSQPVGRNSFFNILFLYNLLYEDGLNTPYNSPIVVRAGFDVGF